MVASPPPYIHIERDGPDALVINRLDPGRADRTVDASIVAESTTYGGYWTSAPGIEIHISDDSDFFHTISSIKAKSPEV